MNFLNFRRTFEHSESSLKFNLIKFSRTFVNICEFSRTIGSGGSRSRPGRNWSSQENLEKNNSDCHPQVISLETEIFNFNQHTCYENLELFCLVESIKLTLYTGLPESFSHQIFTNKMRTKSLSVLILRRHTVYIQFINCVKYQ